MPGFPIIRSSLLSQFPRLVFAMSTRQGPEAGGFDMGGRASAKAGRCETNLRLFLNAVGLTPDEVAFMEQTHEDVVAEALEAGEYSSCDALITCSPNLGLAVRTADCHPVFLYAPGQNALAAVHAGWRGTAAHIAGKAAAALSERYDAEAATLFAYIGPGAGPCCYEIGPETEALFAPEFLIRKDEGKARLNLRAALRRQLIEAGIPGEQIETASCCTICETSLFYSHRREGAAAGRMISVIAALENE